MKRRCGLAPAASRAGLTAVVLASLAFPGCGRTPNATAPPLLVFGRTGLGELEFAYPRALVATNDRSRMYIVDKAGRIQCVTADGAFVLGWRMREIDAGKPTGLGIGPDGKVYAAETHYGRVAVFESDGREIETFGTFGTDPGQFRLPTDVAVDSDGFIYVSEYGGNDRISKFTPTHEFVRFFGDPAAGEASTQRPQALCFARDGTLLVADSCNHRIARFTRDGEFRGAFGHLGAGIGELRFPYSVDILPDDSIVVSEYGNNRVQRFTASGESLGTWGKPGREPGEVAYPWAAAVITNGRVAVLDSGNNRVQIIDGMSAKTWQK